MKRSTRFVYLGLACACIAVACVFLFPILQRGMPMYALSDEFQAPIYLESLLREHGQDQDILIKPADCRRLASLIQQLDHRSVQRTFSTVVLSLLCIIYAVCLFALAKGRNAQPKPEGDGKPAP